MMKPTTWRFKITQYKDKKAMLITKLVYTMWLVSYNWPVYIVYYRGGELLGHNFENSLI